MSHPFRSTCPRDPRRILCRDEVVARGGDDAPHPLVAAARFCAKAILWGASAGASYYLLHHYHHQQQQRQQQQQRGQWRQRKKRNAADDPEEEQERDQEAGLQEIWFRLWKQWDGAARTERMWQSLRPKLPLLLWVSLVASTMPVEQPRGGSMAPPRRWLVSSLLALPWIMWPDDSSREGGRNGAFSSRRRPPPNPSSAAEFLDRHHRHHDDDRQDRRRQLQLPKPPPDAPRYVELLVHNVSHTDLILSLEVDTPDPSTTALSTSSHSDMGLSFVQVASPQPAATASLAHPASLAHRRTASSSGGSARSRSADTTPDDPYCLARPRFSCFEKYSQLVWEHLQSDRDEILYFDRHARHEESHRIVVPPSSSAPLPQTATGFALSEAVPVPDWHEIRLRGRDQDRVGLHWNRCRVRHVFFPLLATLVPRWEERIQAKRYDTAAASVKRVLILVSGVGTPRNWTHDQKGNSTAICARLMKAFLERIDPELTVVHVHSETNIFRYDENLAFVEQELMPQIHAYRDAHARGLPYPDEVVAEATAEAEATEVPPAADRRRVSLRTHPFAPDWRDTFHTTLSFADGSPARTYAIQASLRQYRPTYFHFWQLKTFWHESKIVNNDIEVHSFEAMETIPPVDTQSVTDRHVAMVIEELLAFKAAMVQTLQSDHDIGRFWLRKTHKPVIAVLLVQNDDGDDDQPVLYRGTNMEVSMPTGSLCAERNVIGTALADRPWLKREDLKIIAVLAVPMEPTDASSTSMGDDLNTKGLSSIRRVHSCFACIDPTATKLPRRNPSVGSEEDPEWILPPTRHDSRPTTPESQCDTSSTSPVRTISLFSRPSASPSGPKRTVVLRSGTRARDLNPLRPCGACNEWLKKIAECNPYFKILTFTDAECHGVYITPCQD